MKYSYTLLVPALAVVVSGQTAPDFPVQVDNALVVDFQNTSTSVDPAGVVLAREDVLETPVALGRPDANRQTTYVLFMVDQDVQATEGEPRVQLLHYFAPNMFGSSEVLSFDAQAENGTSAVGASYIPPTPPEGDGPHRYTILAYIQPEGFTVPDAFSGISPPADTSARIGFDMAAFAEAAGLGEPWAATWFQVENKGAASSSGTASGSATATGGGSASTGSSSATATSSGGGSSSASASASASGAASNDNAAGMVDVHASMRQLVLGIALSVAGAGFWML